MNITISAENGTIEISMINLVNQLSDLECICFGEILDKKIKKIEESIEPMDFRRFKHDILKNLDYGNS